MTTVPHVLLAPDKFKGSLTAAEVAAAVEAGVRRVAPGGAGRILPAADGGGRPPLATPAARATTPP